MLLVQCLHHSFYGMDELFDNEYKKKAFLRLLALTYFPRQRQNHYRPLVPLTFHSSSRTIPLLPQLLTISSLDLCHHAFPLRLSHRPGRVRAGASSANAIRDAD